MSRAAGRQAPRAAAWLCASLLALGCAQGDDRPAEWGYLSPVVFQPSCATPSCHSRAVAVAGLDFSDPARGYASLTALAVLIVDPSAGALRPRPLVIAYDPAQSRLVHMLRARGAPRMPPDRPLPERDVELVESWILDGARQSVGGPPASTASAPPPGDASANDGAAGGG